MENYEKLEKVAAGTYGKVYKARERKTGRLVALKKTKLEMDDEGVPSTALREVALLQILSHSIYVVRLLGPLQSCAPHIIKSFMYQLCKGVAHLHSHGVLHSDLKPENLLVDREKGLLKIADLGLGRAFTVPLKSYTHEILTLCYRAPEVLLGSTHYATPLDIWSLPSIHGLTSPFSLIFDFFSGGFD
ncbi:unnamed protein product [Sphagnum troendelagicum]|uniref:cyclin-dependent kinase n=1 Tax=Sphagnum troendelagicum TaxID=128251 RepID=A0ABP0U368_9BRYO